MFLFTFSGPCQKSSHTGTAERARIAGPGTDARAMVRITAPQHAPELLPVGGLRAPAAVLSHGVSLLLSSTPSAEHQIYTAPISAEPQSPVAISAEPQAPVASEGGSVIDGGLAPKVDKPKVTVGSRRPRHPRRRLLHSTRPPCLALAIT